MNVPIKEESKYINEVIRFRDKIIKKIHVLKEQNIIPQVIIMTNKDYNFLRAYLSSEKPWVSVESDFERFGIKMIIHHEMIKEMEVF